MKDDEQLQSLVIDLRRGTLVLAVLSCLKEKKYGYSLLQDMEEQGIRIEANTLYPLLRRLETQGLLISEWDTGESRPRKYYILSKRGTKLQGLLKEEWRRLSQEMEKFLEEEKS
ncbi:MAG: helix-turn-helix transcriptional regulator [Lachnospiraceae bacterium]|nr:helix-turn-helix transcriptional regulator [Lachnospiraceae bacterium]